MTSRDVAALVVSAVVMVGTGNEAWNLHREAAVIRVEAVNATQEATRMTALARSAEEWLASAPPESQANRAASTPAEWMRIAKARGLVVSRFSDRGGAWQVSVEGTPEAVASVLDPRVSTVSMHPSPAPGAAPGRVRAEIAMQPEAATSPQLSTEDLAEFLSSQEPMRAETTAADVSWSLVFRSDALAIPQTSPAALATGLRQVPVPIMVTGGSGGTLANLARLESLPSPASDVAASSVPYDYLGRIEGGTRGICGVFKSRANGLIVSVKQGETLGEWKLVRVAADEVVLSATDEPTRTVKLIRHAQSAAS